MRSIFYILFKESSSFQSFLFSIYCVLSIREGVNIIVLGGLADVRFYYLIDFTLDDLFLVRGVVLRLCCLGDLGFKYLDLALLEDFFDLLNFLDLDVYLEVLKLDLFDFYYCLDLIDLYYLLS